MKKLLLMAAFAAFTLSALADTKTYAPTLDVNFRTAAGNTAWQYAKDAAEDGNTNFEGNYFAGIFTLQKFTVAELQNATSLTLTLTDVSTSGVDGTMLWSYPDNDWTPDASVDDVVARLTEVIGVAPRSSEGEVNAPLATGKKVSGTGGDTGLPARGYFTLTGSALAAVKANATEDGTFTLLITDKSLLSNSSRKFFSSNTAVDEENRPTLVATIEAPAVINKTTGVGYKDLNEAFAAAVAADADAELEVYEDQKITSRLTLNKAHAITITPMKDITIKGGPGMMWFLVNASNGVFNIGSTEHKITLDGESKTMTIDAAVIQRENGGMMNVTNVEFKDFDLGETARLLGDKQQGGVLTIQDITVTNCQNPKGGYIYCLRVANDALVLKGYLNIDEASTGTAILKQGNLKSDGSTEGRMKLAKTDDDVEFTASKELTIDWVGLDGKEVMKEGALVVIGTSGANAPLFKLLSDEWWLARKASNGDMYVTQVDPAPTNGISASPAVPAASSAVYDLSGRRVVQTRKGLYIANGRLMVK